MADGSARSDMNINRNLTGRETAMPRINTRIEQAVMEVLQRRQKETRGNYSGYGSGSTESMVKSDAKRNSEEKIETTLNEVYLAVEKTVYDFVGEGNRQVRCFPQPNIRCLELRSSSGDVTEVYMRYFDRLRPHAWTYDTYHLGAYLGILREWMGRIFLQILVLLPALAAYVATLSVSGLYFLKYTYMFKQIMGDDLFYKLAPSVVWLVFLILYIRMDKNFRRAKSGTCALWGFTHTIVMISTIAGWIFQPFRVGNAHNIYTNAVLIGALYYTLMLVLNLRELFKALRGRRIFVSAVERGEQSFAFSERLLEFHSLWQKEYSDRIHPKIEEHEQMLRDIKSRYEVWK